MAFLRLKELLASYPVLDFPYVDASDHAVGGILSQKDDKGGVHPVSYFSTTLKGPQKKLVCTQ